MCFIARTCSAREGAGGQVDGRNTIRIMTCIAAAAIVVIVGDPLSQDR
jgi:hypothetical protein